MGKLREGGEEFTTIVFVRQHNASLNRATPAVPCQPRNALARRRTGHPQHPTATVLSRPRPTFRWSQLAARIATPGNNLAIRRGARAGPSLNRLFSQCVSNPALQFPWVGAAGTGRRQSQLGGIDLADIGRHLIHLTRVRVGKLVSALLHQVADHLSIVLIRVHPRHSRADQEVRPTFHSRKL